MINCSFLQAYYLQLSVVKCTGWNLNNWPYLGVAVIKEERSSRISQVATRCDQPYGLPLVFMKAASKDE